MASIIVVEGRQKGVFYRLGQVTSVIGRDEALPIQVLDSHVSRRHVQIRFDQRTWTPYIADMGSKNGVLVNGVRLQEEVKLTDGDLITIGTTSLVFTQKDFFDRKSALAHIKKLGEREHPTQSD
ncbi:MAG: FHA domain-containing protein [Planctomycetota bacterium]